MNTISPTLQKAKTPIQPRKSPTMTLKFPGLTYKKYNWISQYYRSSITARPYIFTPREICFSKSILQERTFWAIMAAPIMLLQVSEPLNSSSWCSAAGRRSPRLKKLDHKSNRKEIKLWIAYRKGALLRKKFAVKIQMKHF